jgi:predicted PurR-regulated permease PerM
MSSTWLTWGLCAACALLLWPLLPAVMVALWLAMFARALQRPLTVRFGGRKRLAAALSVLVLVLILTPFVLVFISLAAGAYEFAIDLLHSPRGREVLERLATRSEPSRSLGTRAWDILLSQKQQAWAILQQVAGTATRVVIETFVAIAGTYAILVDGGRWYIWLEQHAPISPATLRRLGDAFEATGRGLFIGIGGSGLLQGMIASIVYLVLGVPRPLELGVLTFIASFIPGIGSGLVWVPLAIGLALVGRTGAAIILVICGTAVIGTVDNIARPWLARRGNLGLPTYVVLVTMFAGVMAMGPWGLLVAPLAVRLTKAVLEAEP